MRFIFLVLTLLASSAYAAEVDTLPPMPLEQQEKAENLQNAMKALEAMQAQIDKEVAQNTNQCMKAIGDSNFCKCICNNMPGNINFVQYVQFFSFGPSDFDYQKLSPEGKKLYDGIRKARDKCVNWKGKQ